MISLEQIRTLEERVTKAVVLIDDLKQENQALKGKLSSYQDRIAELEVLIEDFKKDQGEIEQGIIAAIQQLDSLENVAESSPAQDEPVQTVQEQPEPSAQPAVSFGPPEPYRTQEESSEREEVQEEDTNEPEEEPPSELDIF